MPDLYPLVDFSVEPDFLDQEFETLFPETKAENRKVDNFKIELTKILLEKGYNKKRIVSVFRFLGFIFGIENELLRKKFKKEVNQMTVVKEIEELTDYEEDLIKERETKSLRNKALKLLTKKLGTIPKNLEEKIVSCTDIEKLDNILDNIFDITSFDEVEKILG